MSKLEDGEGSTARNVYPHIIKRVRVVSTVKGTGKNVSLLRRGRMSETIDKSCPVCPTGIQETILYRFGECDSARKALQ